MIHFTGYQPLSDFLLARWEEHQLESDLRDLCKPKPRVDLQIWLLKQKLVRAQIEIDLYSRVLSPCSIQNNAISSTKNSRTHLSEGVCLS